MGIKDTTIIQYKKLWDEVSRELSWSQEIMLIIADMFWHTWKAQMSFEAEKERCILQSSLGPYSWSCCAVPAAPAASPENAVTAGMHPTQEARQPLVPALFGNGQSRRWGPQESWGSTGRCEDGATVEVAVAHTVSMPFSQKVTSIHSLHSPLHWLASTSAVHLFLLQCSKKIWLSAGKRTPETNPTFFSCSVHIQAFGNKDFELSKPVPHTIILILLPHML